MNLGFRDLRFRDLGFRDQLLLLQSGGSMPAKEISKLRALGEMMGLRLNS